MAEKMDRRSVLVALGLAPTAAIGAESFTIDDGEKRVRSAIGDVSQKSMADALRKLAGLIESGDVDATRITMSGALDAGAEMKHSLNLDFFYKA